MLGRVGDDAFAGTLLHNLKTNGVDTSNVRSSKNLASGLAVVAVENSGENAILVVPNANGAVTVDDVAASSKLFTEDAVVLLQLETPMDTVLAAIRLAKSKGARVIVDPAPAPAKWPEELFNVDLMCPNESEAASFLKNDVNTIAEAERAAREIHDRGAKNVVITMGEQGSLLFDGDSVDLIPAYSVTAVDSTAAGDAFAGALAVHWAQHNNLLEAVRFGNAAGALSASRMGAQPSMASRTEIEALCFLPH